MDRDRQDTRAARLVGDERPGGRREVGNALVRGAPVAAAVVDHGQLDAAVGADGDVADDALPAGAAECAGEGDECVGRAKAGRARADHVAVPGGFAGDGAAGGLGRRGLRPAVAARCDLGRKSVASIADGGRRGAVADPAICSAEPPTGAANDVAKASAARRPRASGQGAAIDVIGTATGAASSGSVGVRRIGECGAGGQRREQRDAERAQDGQSRDAPQEVRQ